MSFGLMVIVLATWENILICAQERAKLEKRRLAKPVTGECSRVEIFNNVPLCDEHQMRNFLSSPR